MGRVFDVNNQRQTSEYSGASMFAFKELAVAVGWTVVGSGDGDTRFAYAGVTSALSGGHQGSGGAYDCWRAGSVRTNATTAVPGDAGNASAWVVLANAGREVLIQNTSQTSGWDGYGRMAYNPGTGATSAFVGSTAATATAPGAASNERWLIGSRGSPTGDTWLAYNTAGYYHIWGSTTDGAGGARALGLVFVKSSDSTVQRYFCFAPVDDGTELAGDADPTVAYCGTTLPGTNGPSGSVWNHLTSAMELVGGSALGYPAAGQGNSVGGNDQLTQLYAACTYSSGNRYYKGVVTVDAIATTPTQRGWGNRGEDGDGVGWCHMGGSSGLLMPWPDAATVPLP
jgi:hypothetical protein